MLKRTRPVCVPTFLLSTPRYACVSNFFSTSLFARAEGKDKTDSWIKEIAGRELERMQTDKEKKKEKEAFFSSLRDLAPETEEEEEDEDDYSARYLEQDETEEMDDMMMGTKKEDEDDNKNVDLSPIREFIEEGYPDLVEMVDELNAHNHKRLVRRKRDADYWKNRDALARACRQRRDARWAKKRDLVYSSDLFVKLGDGIPSQHLPLLQQQLDMFAVALGNNPSWSLDHKRQAMEGWVKFFKSAYSERYPRRFNMFTDFNKRKWYLEDPKEAKKRKEEALKAQEQQKLQK